MSVEIKIPDLGENIESGRVVGIMVAVGDTIAIDQPLLELETDKAVLEVPAIEAGTIEKILVNEGDDVAAGTAVFLLSAEVVEESLETALREETPAEEEPEAEVQPEPQTVPEPEVVPEATVAQEVPAVERDVTKMAPTAPSVRRFAREIGIDIFAVPGSGPAGRINIDDVKRYAKQLNAQRGSGGVLPGLEAETLPDFSKWGPVEPKSMSKLRETAAKHLSYAWATIPHVTQFDKADITDLEALRKQHAPLAEAAGGKLTVTAILVKVIQMALQKFPEFNASIDMQKTQVIYKNYYNIGIAVDTQAGLLVPVIKDVDKKNIIQLAAELATISVKARDRKLSMDEMQGGNFSISNLGGIGGTGFTPVVNSPEVAILGVSRSEMQPVYQADGTFEPRLVMPLSLSYDHRLIDGAAAAKFLRWVCRALEQPFLLLLEG